MLLPHGVAPTMSGGRQQRGTSSSAGNNNNNMSSAGISSSSSSSSNGANKKRSNISGYNTSSNSRVAVLTVIATAIPSFFLGTLWSAVLGMSSSSSCSKDHEGSSSSLQQQQQQQLQRRGADGGILSQQEGNDVLNVEVLCREHAAAALENQAEHAAAAERANSLFPVEAVGRYAVAMARTSKQDFTDSYDLGVPLDLPSAGSEDMLLLYSSAKALPNSLRNSNSNSNNNNNNNEEHFDPSTSIPHLSMPAAVENCDYLNVILTDHGKQRNQCIAIIPQYESYHVQKWMRVDGMGKLSRKSDLKMVSRGHQTNGLDQFRPPDLVRHTRKHWAMLQSYFETVDDVLAELKPILTRIAVQNTVIVMVCNFGQSELLLNFVCAARRRNLDVSNIVVFTTDQETTDLAEGMGLTAYFDHRNFGDIPVEAAGRYGDAKFVAMMMAKVICVQLVSMLGFDFLFQDVDIVWYKNPLDYFHNKELEAHKYDAFFQDDGGHSIRYAPYSANSGFYFVRHNQRTRHFLTALLMAGDLVLSFDSHQQALIATLNDHVSLYGLKVKVLSRDLEEFPGGFQFHQKSKKYMLEFFAGKLHPYIFHMSWTLNKNNKLLFFRQMGDWYVEDQCIQQKIGEISGADADDLAPTCCSAEPIFSCHYSDKPSLKPCKDFPPIDKGRKSWW